jgi:succinate dehydrogenase/fumarate reductase flavoprotein subunit
VPSKAQESSFGARDIRWNYEADVVVLGSGCVGLHAAVRARDLGASVLVIEQNFDVGGKCIAAAGPRLAAATPSRNGTAPVPIPRALD